MVVGLVIGLAAGGEDADSVRARADGDTGAELVELRAQLDDAEERADDAEDALADAEATITSLRDTAAADADADREALEAEVRAEIEDGLEERATRLDERDAAVEEREAAANERDAGLDEREAGLDARATELDERESELDEREAGAANDGSTTTSIPARSFGDGVHVVGRDIRPGTYRGNSDGGACYWARLSALDGEQGSVVASDLVDEGTITLTIAATDAGFETTGCGIWAPAG
ncbi:MAG: hypothetical protein S0880_34545 [Actinomycetota bacterium]|nr:hypothetical protein [Actinomycetota bacterium]